MTDFVDQAFNAAGQLIFDQSSYAGSASSSFPTNGQATGTYADAALIGKRLVHFVLQNNSFYGGPNVTLNPANGVMTWTYTYSSSGSPPVIPNETVYYGYY